MGKLWESYGKVMGKLWELYGKIVSHGKVMGK